jgi:hypothetical protein
LDTWYYYIELNGKNTYNSKKSQNFVKISFCIATIHVKWDFIEW